MTEPQRIDPERLAALLDGRLGEAEAAAVRAELSHADDDTLSAFADAAAVSAELAGRTSSPKDPGAEVVSIESATGARRWRVPTALAAAGIVAVVAWRMASGANTYPPSRFADAIPTGSRPHGGPVWSATRGGTDGVSDRGRAIRIGAVLTDLELDVIRGDTTTADAIALANLLEGLSGGVAIATPLRSLIADSSLRLSRARLEEIGRQSFGLVDRQLATAGAYLEAARLATEPGEASFFDRISATPLARLRRDRSLDGLAKGALTTLDSLAQVRPRNAGALHASITELLRSLAQ